MMESEIIFYLCICFVLNCVTRVHAFSVYRSCMDVLNVKRRNATDGEYVIFLENNVGVSIYCHGKLHP